MLWKLPFQWRLTEDAGEFGSITKSIQEPCLGVKWKVQLKGRSKNALLLSQGTVSQYTLPLVQ